MRSHSKENKRLAIALTLFTVLMLGFCYALVPLYNVFCKLTGLNGKTAGPEPLSQTSIEQERLITVEFVSNLNANLPWKFYPLTYKVQVHPGENKQIVYFAENDSGKTMTVQAIPSLTPGEAAKYFIKTECFCFRQQTLKNGKSTKLPMIFHLDKAIPKEITTITMLYTLFDASWVKTKS